MAVQSAMNVALSALRSAVGNDKKHKTILNKLRDAFKAVEADELPRSEIVERGMRLADITSESVTGLHKTRPRPALAFCAAALSWLFKAKLEPALERGDEESARAWEDIIFRGLMQPILNIVDSEDQAVVGNVLYKVICGIMRSPQSQVFGGRFARSLALVLLCTCSSSTNKAIILDPSVLGTDTLSKLIIDAKDYHYLDTLLELSFTMFSSQGGKVTRKAYADNIFSSGYALKRLPDDISNELASIHSVTNGGNSEKHILDIMRTMSRAGIERQATRHIILRYELTYALGLNNVIILDHENLCIVFSDKNGDSDVLAVATTTIKGVKLTPQDASRIIVELVISDTPLISSSREELAIPDSHIPGSPLKIRLSIASSDVFGLEAALTARDLAGALEDDNALTQQSSMASTKISNAASSIPLKKNRNPSNEQAEEMIRRYVNLPSSRDGSSPLPAARVKSTTRAAPPKPLPPRAPVTPATTAKPTAPSQPKELRNESPVVPRRVDGSTLRPPVPLPAGSAPLNTTGSGTARTRRVAAEKSQKVTKLAALAGMNGSEPTDVNPGVTPEHSGQRAINPPGDDTNILPTPPRTRARAQQTKPVAKTLVPSTPARDDPPEVSSPPDVPSPSPKPARKRKLVDDDPFELPPLKIGRTTKQKGVEHTSILSGSQHIQSRGTAATRAKAKYGIISKRMRVSSPVESIHSADSEGDDSSLRKKAPTATVGKKREVTSVKGVTATRTRSHTDKDDNLDAPKRQTRATVAKAKTKPAANVNRAKPIQNKVLELSAITASETEAVEAPEPPKKKRGRPPKNKLTQQPVTLPEPSSGIADSIERAPSQCEDQSRGILSEVGPTRTDEKDKADQTPATPTHETMVTTQESVPEDDDLLERLSQAAKKALKPPIADNQPTGSPRRPLSLVMAAEIELEDPNADIDTIEPPVQGLETNSSEEFAYQTQNTTPHPMEIPGTHSNLKRLSARVEKEPKNTGAGAEILDVPQSSDSKSGDHPNNSRASTRLQVVEDPPIHGIPDQVSVDSTDTKKSPPVSFRPTVAVDSKVTHQQDPKPASAVTRVKTHAPTSEENKHTTSPKTSVQLEATRTTQRIQAEETRTTTAQTVVHQVETPPAKDMHQTKFPPVFIPVDPDVEMEPSQEPTSHRTRVEPTRRSGVLASRTTPVVQPVAKPQFHPAPAPTGVKHAAVTRVLFNTSAQSSPKSALASPQRRTLANGTRPSVSFLEPPAPITRRGSSSSSTKETPEQQSYCIDREKLREGQSTRTGDVILQITDIMMEIQETIALNLGEKIQTINTEARSARVELTKSVLEELDVMKAESDSHHNVLHKFESVFASQAQAMLKGLNGVVERDDCINTGIRNILAANARAGQSIAKSTLNFEVPELFGAFFR
ncbi:unnamed protein product [Rhizoctonia solani]|uniref:Uncharacterized protein n=1 Tax=Rhizoctonia solani TaxID=456999 RepID=A0A8H3GQA2_9AGAM|nr:unnamed protein product [Rhizoctonia solani]